jgi:7,8-dihydroneopterin aldolase/epimerase/oxygenase
MGRIKLENMEFYAYHGCFKEEQVVGNYFMVTVEIDTDCFIAASSDNIADALNYQTVFTIVKQEMQITSHLLEHVAGRIIEQLKSTFNSINRVSVTVSKMNPPLGGKTDRVSVTLEA